jgi:hypothetical protein
MPITPFLKDQNFTPDLMRVVKVAFAMTRAAQWQDTAVSKTLHSLMHGSKGESDALGEALQHLADDHPAVTTAAKRIVELAKGGKCNPDRLCEQALSEIGDPRFQQQAPFDVQRGPGF